MEVLINLLPWRERQRELLKQEFLILLGAASILTLIIVGSVFLIYSRVISFQEHQNKKLSAEISSLDQQIKTIEGYENEKQRLVARMMIIQDLQARRPQTVKVFDTVAKIIPDGIYLNSIVRQADNVTLAGVAESNSDVSNLMRALEATGWLKNATLSEVKTGTKKDGSLEFKMAIEIITDLNGDSQKYLVKNKKDKVNSKAPAKKATK